MPGLLKHLRERWFLVALAAVIVLGFWLCDELAHLPKIAALRNGIVLVVMFLMALPLALKSFAASLRRPQAALLAVAMNAVVVPLLAWGGAWGLRLSAADATLARDMALGLMIAGSTPCTLASAAVWTRRAGGNETIAILVTIVTNMACFLVLPFWLRMFTGEAVSLSFSKMAIELLLLVVVPIAVAQLVRLYRPLGDWATARRVPLSVAAQLGILSMVGLGAISAGLKLGGDATQLLGWDKALMIAAALGVHLVALFLGLGTSLALKQPREDAIAVGIAGSQKTLMVGLHVAIDYFGGLAMLPMIVYHIGQLLADTIIADWLRRD